MKRAPLPEPVIDASEVSRLAALPWPTYDLERREAARALGVETRALDQAVYRRRGDLARQAAGGGAP